MRISRVIALIILLMSMVIHDGAAAQSHPAQLYYFNPDSPQSNLSRLKRDMDNFLSATGLSITFQPFAHLLDLQNQLKERSPAFLFVPEWYLKRYGRMLKLHPLLIPVRQGEASYRKVLLGAGNADLNFIRNAHPTVAMTSMGPDGDSVLNTILFSPHGMRVGKINAIIVPKDTDALFALALGQVDMALVVKQNVDMISKINPNILRLVHPLLESKPIPMPVLCYTEGVATAADIREFKDLFLGAMAQKRGSIVMEMLQINGWQAVNQ
jgi:ABC transporter, phosphonate, periplasmic substrate-binding protein